MCTITVVSMLFTIQVNEVCALHQKLENVFLILNYENIPPDKIRKLTAGLLLFKFSCSQPAT